MIRLLLLPLLLASTLLMAAPGPRTKAVEKPIAAGRPAAGVAPATDAAFTYVSPVALDERTEARRAFASLDARDQYVEGNLSYEDLVTLPVGIRKKIGESTIEMAVSKAVFLSDKAELTVYIRMTIPVADASTGTTDRVLFFGADRVGVTRNGGLTGDFRAVLLGDFVLPLRNYSIVLRGGVGMAQYGQVAGDDFTYAEFSCGSGFKEARIVAEVVFPREVLIPVSRDTYEEVPGRVTGGFMFTSNKGLHDVVIEGISMSTAFKIRGAGDFAFELNGLSIDLSQTQNPADFNLPGNFPTPKPLSWEGVYLKFLRVVMPPEFRKKGDSRRIYLDATNLLVDRQGFSGQLAVGSTVPDTGPVKLAEGDASGWKFAVDRVELTFETNRMTKGAFAGRIGLPVSNENSQGVGFAAQIDNAGKYHLEIANLNQVDFSFMRAKATLSPGSRLVLDVVDKKFKPKAILSGSMGIYAGLNDTGNTPVNENANNLIVFKGIAFQNLVLQTDAPRIAIGSMAYEQSGKMALFPVVINSFEILQPSATNDKIFAVGIGVSVNLMGTTTGKGFSGNTLVTFEAQENDEGRWRFTGLKKPVDIFLNTDVSAFSLNGHVSLYDNATGKGFQGGIDLTIQYPKRIQVCARAKFGYDVNDNERYWYVDALGSGLSVPLAGPLLLDGLAGGVYSKFRPLPPTNPVTVASMTCDSREAVMPYAYDKTVSLGFKAAALLKTTGDNFRGRVGFEIVLNSYFGVSSVGFYGRGELSAQPPAGGEVGVGNELAKNLKNVVASSPAMDKIVSTANRMQSRGRSVDDSLAPAPSGNIAFWFGMLWDSDNSTLHGDAEAYVNIGNALTGTGPYGRMGWMQLHFDPAKWYVHAGNPKDRLGLKLQLGPVRAQVASYIMAGHGIPTQLTLPPPQVISILNLNTNSSEFQRSGADAAKLTSGQGLALGVALDVNTGPMQYAIFYGQFGVGAGVDLLMLKSNPPLSCSGTDAGSNGYYGSGQFYAYLQGEFGVRFKRRYYEVISGGVAARLQGGMPKPAWFDGRVGGKVRILGAKIKFQMNVAMGNPCN